MSSNAVETSNNMLTPQGGIFSSFSSPVGNRRSREAPTAMVVPRISVLSTVGIGSDTVTRTSTSAGEEIGRRPFLAATPPSTSDPRLIRFNRTSSAEREAGVPSIRRSQGAFLSLLEASPSSSSTGGGETQRPGLLGLMEDPVTPSGVYRNPNHGVRSRTPREPSTENQHSSSSFGRRILTEGSWNLNLAESMTEGQTTSNVAPALRSVVQHEAGVSEGSPTEEPTRKILADHAELIRALQNNIEQLKREAHSSRPVSPYNLSSEYQSANTSGLASIAGAEIFSGALNAGGQRAGICRYSYPDLLVEAERSREQVVEKEVVICRLKRRLERAESELELVQFENSSAVEELNQSVTENQILRRRIRKLEGLVEAQKNAKEHREKQATKIRELEEKVEVAEEWKREAEWRAFQNDALECLIAVRQTEIKELEKAEKERRMTDSSSVCVTVAKVLAEQRTDLAGITRRLRSLFDTTKQFRRHKGRKAMDLNKLLGLEKTVDSDHAVSEDLNTESQRCGEEIANLKNALKGLNDEMIELFLDQTAKNITMN